MTEGMRYIMDALKKFQQNAWDIEAFDECKKILPSLSEEEQKAVYHSKWLDKGNKLYPIVFELVYKDKLLVVLSELEKSGTMDLIHILQNTKSSYKKGKIREILQNRYSNMNEKEKAEAFKILLADLSHNCS